MTLLFNYFVNKFAINKNVPNFIKQINPKLQMSFIKGLFLGDGSCTSNNKVSFATISECLAYDVAHILERNGIKCSCIKKDAYIDKNNINHKTSYIIEINSNEFNKYWKIFENSNELFSYDVNDKEKYSSKQILTINNKKYLAKRINKKTEYFYDGYVYCLNVNNVHSFKLEGISVHNCIAFWNKYTIDDRDLPFGDNANVVDYSKIDEIVLKLFNHFTDFYLEVQPHNTQAQKEINAHIMELHYKYNIPIIAGTDSHVIYESQMADRDDLLKSNSINYPDEQGWFMDYPSLETFIKRFQTQKILNDDEIYEAINNTNKILNFEDIKLNRNLKVPILKTLKGKTQQERNQHLKDILTKEWNLQKGDINVTKHDEYIKAINYEYNEIEKCNMADYFIDTYEIMKLGISKYGGVLTPSGRGSAVSDYINKLLRLTKVDRINAPVTMYPERFLTANKIIESKTLPDIDSNCSDREPFIKAQKDLIGEQGTFDLIAFGKLHYKSAFKMYARAYNLDPQLANQVTKQINQYELAIKHADDDEAKDLIDIYDYVDKEKYENLIDGCQQYMGIIDNFKPHPCSTICADFDVIEEIGVIMVKSESQKNTKGTFVAVIESGTIDSFGMLKQDYLKVSSIGLIYDIYKEVGIKPFTVNELLKKIDNNNKVWDIYSNGYTMGVNQCEQSKTTQKVMTYKPQNISELTQFIAAIRPSFQSMYKTFEARQHFDYGIKAFDNLIQDEYMSSSFILYQEILMKVLSFAGFPMSETYTIIKAISKKKHYVINNAKEKFIPNFAQAILNTKETNNKDTAIQMSNKVWKVIEDSASYGFNCSHAFCMAIDSVTLAYLKAYYPLEFYKVTLQKYTDDGNKNKVSLLKKEMITRGFELKPIKFGDDNRYFTIDKQHNCINQTMCSIKKMQKIVPQIMYKNKDKTFNSMYDLFNFIINSNINKTSIDILIKLNYFSNYGNINQLLFGLSVYEKYISSNVLTKFKLTSLELKALVGCYKKETDKQIRDIDNIKFISNIISLTPIPPSTSLDSICYELELLGYTDITIPDSPYYAVESVDINQYGTPFINLYQISNGISFQYKCDKKFFNAYPCEQGDILDVAFRTKQKKRFIGTDDKGKNIYEDTNETEEIIKL
ncbi:MAG: LAGLIDADG family homing endonuclease, partial [Bacilli bacterium]